MYDNLEAEAATKGEKELIEAKSKRDSGFQIFYVFINIGGLVAPFIAPLLRYIHTRVSSSTGTGEKNNRQTSFSVKITHQGSKSWVLGTLDRILSRPELQDVHILFGPTQPDQLSKAARFAASRNIRLVVPFSSKEDEVFRNPCVYQVNTPQSYLYSEVYEHFFRQFRHPNVVFLQSAGHHDKDDFIQGLRNELHRRNLSFHTLPDTVSVRALESVTDTTRTNLYIPTTGSNISLIRLIPQLTLLVRQHPSADIHLFGYPEWQTLLKYPQIQGTTL